MDEGVDLDVAARGAVWARFLNMGQVCTSAKRFYVLDGVFDEFVDRFVAFAKTLRIGDPLGPDVDLGPMVSASQREKVEKKVAESVAGGGAGARPAAGARPGFDKGFFYEPTALVDVTAATCRSCARRPSGRWRRSSAAATSTRPSRWPTAASSASGASIYTNNLEHAMKAMEAIHAGTFWINDPLTDNDAGPFGGMRRSGIGRELGSEGIEDFRDSKHVHLDYVIGAKSYWFPYRFARPDPDPALLGDLQLHALGGQRLEERLRRHRALRRAHPARGDGAVQDHAGHDRGREAGVAGHRGERRLPLRPRGEVEAQRHRPPPDAPLHHHRHAVAVVHEGGRRRHRAEAVEEHGARRHPARARAGVGEAEVDEQLHALDDDGVVGDLERRTRGCPCRGR